MKSNVYNNVVKNDLCIGCGVCKAICPKKSIEIGFDKFGKYSVESIDECNDKCGLCLKVCPVNTKRNECNEDSLAKELFLNQEHNEYLGFYKDLYVGYADNLRLEGSSGGIARFLPAELLQKNLVDYVVHVVANDDSDKLFKFSIATNSNDLANSSKSAYYPLEMSEVLDFISKNEGRYAITALPCFIKGIRLAQKLNSKLKERICYIFGLTCGQLKSKHFTQYCASLGGLTPKKEVTNISFREKDENQPSNNFYFKIKNDKQNCNLFWESKVDPIWSNKWFTPNACNFCDDIFAELADVSFMDAWLPKYRKDWKGTNIVISRSEKISKLIEQAKNESNLSVSEIEPDEVIKSQQGVIDNKRRQLGWRLYLAQKKQKPFPKKRVASMKPNFYNHDFLKMLVKERIRKKSFKYCPDIFHNIFYKMEMQFYTSQLDIIDIFVKQIVLAKKLYRKLRRA